MAGPSAQALPYQLVMIDDFLIDVVLSEDHTFESDVTEYPVESGSNITDNVRPRPIVVTMECLVSNTPIGFLASRHPNGEQGGGGEPADDCYELLQKIRDKREPVIIRTSLRTFDNMVLKSLSIPRAKDRGDALKFTASFQQIQVVTNKRTRRIAVPGGGGRNNKGQLPATFKDLPGIPVISFAQTARATVTKSLGAPILSTVEGVTPKTLQAVGVVYKTLREPDGRGPLDHYKSPGMPNPEPTQFDGYVLDGRYFRCQLSGGSSTELLYSLNGQYVEYDYNQKAWVDAKDRKKIVQKVPSAPERWKGVTVYNPKNGTGQTY